MEGADSEGLALFSSATWAALDGTDPFAGIVVAARIDGTFHLFAMWVAPELRRRGIGSRLLDVAIAWINEVAPGRAFQLEVNPHEAAAVHLYESKRSRSTGKSSPLGLTPGEEIHEMVRPD